MTVPVENNIVTYNCDGSKTEFEFSFKVFQTSDIKVILVTIADGTEAVGTETTDYAVTGSLSSGGKVTTVETWSSLYKITIKLDIDLDQETDLIYGGSYSSEAVETMSDKLTKIAQQLTEITGRAIKFKETSGEKDIEIDNLVADKTLVVDSTGVKIVMGEQGGSGSSGFSSPSELTINAETVTISGNAKWRFHNIDTESDAASGNLHTVNGGNTGDMLLLQAENSARTVVCKDGTSLKMGSDFSLNNVEDKIIFVCISSGVWHETSRSSNGG